jgi:hypothetical protein
MGYLSERVSYLRGLADGLSLNKESAESRLFDEIIELLDDISSSVEGLEEQHGDLADEVSDMEESICDLEEEVYADDEYYDDEDCVCEELACPNCDTILPIDADLFESEEIHITCPTCGEDVTIELEDDDCFDDCDGDCCCCCEDCDEE